MEKTYYLINGVRYFCFSVHKNKLVFERLVFPGMTMEWKTLTRKQFNAGLLDGSIEED